MERVFNDTYMTSISCHYRTAQFLQVFFSLSAIILAIFYVWKHHSKHILPRNIFVFINILITLVIIHSLDMILFHVYHGFKSFLAEISNSINQDVQISFCTPFRYIYTYYIISSVFIIYCIFADRSICLFYKYYMNYRNIILGVLTLKLVVLPIIGTIWVYWQENNDANITSCLDVPEESIFQLTSTVAAVLPLNVIALFISVLFFKKFRNSERNCTFEIISQFNAKINASCSEFIFIITATKSFFIVLYTILMLILRHFYNNIPISLRPTLTTLANVRVFSIYCNVVLVLMIVYATKSERQRRNNILRNVSINSVGVEGADNYFRNLKSQWN